MKRRTVLTLLLSVLLGLPLYFLLTHAWAGGEPVQTVPIAGSSFQSNLQAFLRAEFASWFEKAALTNYVSSGGLHATAASCTSSAFSVDAVTSSGNRITADGAGGAVSINYSAANIAANCANPGSDVCWVVGSSAGQAFSVTNGRSVVTMPTLPASAFNRVGSSNLYVDCTSSTTTTLPPPTLPADSVYLFKVAITNGAITTVTDLRQPASYAKSGVYDITDPLYGATGNGTTDDTAAIQAALSRGAGTVICPPGDYKYTSTLTISNAVRFVGMGAYPGGSTTGPDARYRGCALDHAFSGTGINIPGVSGNVVSSIGASIENILMRQVNGTGAAASGIGINVVATSDSYKASWVHILNVNFETSAGSKDDWTWNVVLDGDATTSTSAGGSRDHRLQGGRWWAGAQSTGSLKIRAAANVHISDIFPQGINCNIDISGADTDHASYNTSLAGVQSSCRLVLDWSVGTTCAGCQFDVLTTTANTNGTFYTGSLSASGGLSLVGTNANSTVLATGANGHYLNANGVQGFHLSSATNSSATLGLGWDQTDRWQWILAGSDGSFVLNGPGGTNFESINNNGGRTWKKAEARSIIALTDGATVAVDATLGSRFYLNAGGSRTISNLSSSISGQEVEITVRNGTAGAITTTWDTKYKLAGAAWTDPAPGYTRSVRFYVHDSNTFRELSRTAADAL